jgi:hypothetical protein
LYNNLQQQLAYSNYSPTTYSPTKTSSYQASNYSPTNTYSPTSTYASTNTYSPTNTYAPKDYSTHQFNYAVDNSKAYTDNSWKNQTNISAPDYSKYFADNSKHYTDNSSYYNNQQSYSSKDNSLHDYSKWNNTQIYAPNTLSYSAPSTSHTFSAVDNSSFYAPKIHISSGKDNYSPPQHDGATTQTGNGYTMASYTSGQDTGGYGSSGLGLDFLKGILPQGVGGGTMNLLQGGGLSPESFFGGGLFPNGVAG